MNEQQPPPLPNNPFKIVSSKVFDPIGLPIEGLQMANEIYYTINQVAKWLGCSQQPIRDRVNEGLIHAILAPGLRSGKKLIPQSELRRYLDAR